jgi:acetyltransferase-like isoleucine patch superfamily enzyme
MYRRILNKIEQFRSAITHQRIGRSTSLINCKLGKHISVGDNCYLYKATINDYTYLSKDVCVMNTDIGKFCSIAQGVIISGGNHPSNTFVSTSPVFFSPYKQCGTTFSDDTYFREMGHSTIGNDVWIGANAILKDDITIGDGAIVGAGAIVTKDVPPYAIVAGNPAKLIRYRFQPEEIDFLQKFKWWEKDEVWLKKNFKDFHDIATFQKKHDNS